MSNLRAILDELTAKGIDTDQLKEILVKNHKKLQKNSDINDLQVMIYRLMAPVFGAGEARTIAAKIVPILPELLKNELVDGEKREDIGRPAFFTLTHQGETLTGYLPRSFHQGLLKLASQPPITYLELNEYFFSISDSSLDSLVRDQSAEEIFQWTTKRLLSWPKLYGEDEHDIYLFYFSDFEDKHVMHSNDIVFHARETWDRIGIRIIWPIEERKLRDLNATSIILYMMNLAFKHLAGIFEWKRLFSKIEKDAIINANIDELNTFFIHLLQGYLNYFINPRIHDHSFSIKLESVHDFKHELGFTPEQFIKTSDPSLQQFGSRLMNLMFHWKLFRWMGFRDEGHGNTSKESFFDLFILLCRDILGFNISSPLQIPSLAEIKKRCEEIAPEKPFEKAIVEPIAKELTYLVKIVTLKGGINQDLTMSFRNGYLSARIGKTLHQIYTYYLEWKGEEKGQESFVLYIYRVAAEGLVSSNNMVIKKSLQYLIDMEEEGFGRNKNRTIKSDMVQDLLKLHNVILIKKLDDAESTQQWIKNTVLQVFSFVHGARLFKLLREGFKRFEERPIRVIWNPDEQEEMHSELQSMLSRALETKETILSIQNIIKRAMQEGIRKIPPDNEIFDTIIENLPLEKNLTLKENVHQFVLVLTNLLHSHINPLLGRKTEEKEERVSFTDELDQAVTTEIFLQRIFRENHENFSKIAKNKSTWLYQQDDSIIKELEPLLIGGVISLVLHKRPLSNDEYKILSFEDILQLLETELLHLSHTSIIQEKDDSEKIKLFKTYIIDSVELWSNVFRVSDLLSVFLQSQDFLDAFSITVNNTNKENLLQKPEIRSFLAQHYIRGWISAWFNHGIDFAENAVNTPDPPEELLWEIVDATRRVHFPQFLRWFLIGNTNLSLERINHLMEKYLLLTETIVQGEFLSLYPEICLAFLVLHGSGTRNLTHLSSLLQIPNTECDIHFLKSGEIHSVMNLLTDSDAPFPKDILKNVAALSILHGLELEAITFRLPSSSIYLTMSYFPRVSAFTDVAGTTSIILTMQRPLSEQIADLAPKNAEVISGLYSLFTDNPIDNPIGKLVLLQRLRFTTIAALKNLDFIKKMKMPSDLDIQLSISKDETTLSRDYDVIGLFHLKLGKIDQSTSESKIYVRKIQFYGKKLNQFLYINQFFLAFLPLSTTVSHSLETSKSLGTKTYLARGRSLFLTPVASIFRFKDENDDKRKIIILYDSPTEDTMDLCILWESKMVKEPYSVNKARFILESNRVKETGAWNLENLASKIFSLPVRTPYFDVTKKDTTTGKEMPETDLEKIESISLGGF